MKNKILLWFGVILILGGLVAVVNSFLFFSGNETAEGKIISIEQQAGGGRAGGYTFYPTIEFTAVDDKQYVFQSDFGGSENKYYSPYVIGQAISVSYEADNPQQARVNTFWSFALLPIVLLGMGIIFTVLSKKNSKYLGD